MPGMDGFETAALIRQRKSSEHVRSSSSPRRPRDHARAVIRSGAVDYILAPVVPEILRTKVAVFVDLYRKTEQSAGRPSRCTGAHSAAEARRRPRWRSTAPSMEKMLRVITDTVREIVGAHQAITLSSTARRKRPHKTHSGRVASPTSTPLARPAAPARPDRHTVVAQSRVATRMIRASCTSTPTGRSPQRSPTVPPVTAACSPRP